MSLCQSPVQFRVALLQLDERLLRAVDRRVGAGILLLEFGESVRAGVQSVRGVETAPVASALELRRAVRAIEIGELQRVEINPLRPELMQHHRDRQSPVAEMVLPEHLAAESFEDAPEGVTDDRRPQVADVHLLRHVHRAHVDHDRVRRRLAARPRGRRRPSHPPSTPARRCGAGC